MVQTPVGLFTVATISDLRAIAASSLNQLASVGGSSGFFGLFQWDAASVAADDGATIVTPTGYTGAGRWVKQV